MNLSAEERQEGRLSPQTTAQARQAILEDGYVVLENVVDLAHIAILRDRMLEDLPAILARSDAPFNFTRSNVQQDPPPFHPYLFKDVLLNDFVIDVSESVLGRGVQNAFYSGNTALPNTDQRQPVHADLGHLWPNMTVATPPYALVVNVPVVDMSIENGSTEIWPGTHLDTSVAWQDGDIKVSTETLERRRAVRPPLQPNVKAGSVLIRDIRMWHAGTPNHTPEPRPMIAMIHWPTWWHTDGEMTFPIETKEFFEHPRLRTSAKFIDKKLDYQSRHGAYDLQSV